MGKFNQRKMKRKNYTRLACFRSETFDAEARTVELVWSTGAEVDRGFYIERLSMDADAVDLSRLNNGAALLNSHNMYDLSSQIGVVEKAWLEGSDGVALVRFSERDEVAGIVQDVQGRIIRNVSVGYTISEFTKEERKGELPIITATRWQPHEISLVTVPADPSANVRSADEEEDDPCADAINRAVAQTKEREMPIENNGGEPVAQQPQAETRVLDSAALLAAERERTRAIRTAGRALNVEQSVVDQMIDSGVTADQARAKFIDLHAEASEASRIAARPADVATDRPSGDDPNVIGRAMSESIAARFSPRVTPSDHARQFMSHSITDMAADLLRANGVKVVTRSRPEIIRMAMEFRSPGYGATGDFSSVLLNASNKLLMGEYAQKPQTYRTIAKKRNFTDFKPHNFIRLGDFPGLLQVGESGEFKSGSMQDGKEQVTLATYGRVIALSRQALINDDLGAFADMNMKIGRRVSDFENQTFYALLALNSGGGPTMLDGVAMFHANHANKAGTASAIDVANVGIARAAIRKQVGMTDSADKKTAGIKLNLEAKYLVCGPDKETQALQLVAPVTATQTSNVNPYSTLLSPVVDANISGNAWYMFADPADAEAFIYGYLEGQEGPRVEARNGFTSDGIEFKVALDFAAGGVDYRPGYFNAGA